MTTFASILSGGGGADLGAQAAGFTPLWAVEYDAAIAGVYRANLGDHIIVADVCDVDYTALPRVDWLHASPVCTRYSVANSQRGESDLDIATAQATARAIEATRPRYVTIENVQQYAGSDALRLITNTLDRLGYWWHAEVMNSADYGVPQTRRRLIVRASLDMLRPMPAPVRWIGWYEAIEDLIPTLPPSKFAAWQLKRLPEEITTTTMFGAGGYDNTIVRVEHADPSFLITANNNQSNQLRAFIVSNSATEYSDGIRDAAQPAHTTTAQQGGRYRAFLVDGQKAGDPTGDRGVTVRNAAEPAFTTTSSTTKHPARAWLSQGRVIQMSPRALARFQAFPDAYALPDKAALACRVIGNAVPPLLMQRVGENW